MESKKTTRDYWIRECINRVFEKARKDSNEENPNSLSTFLHEKQKIGVSVRNLTRYYDFFVEGKEKEKINPGKYSRDQLSKYLGCENYTDFLNENQSAEEKQKRIEEERKNKIKLGSSILVVLVGIVVFVWSYTPNKCMIWEIDHYEMTECNGERGVIKYDQETYEGMKQLFGLCSSDTFFLPSDEPVVWYDKYHNQLTFFTMPGIHPTNGRTLKPITQHIIDTYVERCE